MKLIDADRMINEIDESLMRAEQEDGNTAEAMKILFAGVRAAIQCQPTLGPVTHNLIKNPEDLPKSEKDVLMKVQLVTDRGRFLYLYVAGFYEDGSIEADNSQYCWDEVEEKMCEYDEKFQLYRVPKGWYERSLYMGDYGVGCIEDNVVAWWYMEDIGNDDDSANG